VSEPARQLSDEARETAAEWCARLSDGPLGPREQLSFQGWLDSDPEHPALFERTVVAWGAIEDQASQPELLKMRGDALDNVHRAGRRRWSRPGFDWRQLLALAACLLIVVGIGSWARYAPTTYETGIGQRQVVALSDGSSISLDAATRVDVRYLGDRRELWLEHGRAKFSVAKDPLRPFSVQAGDRMVIATGTQFSVEKLADEVRVVLYEGHVAVVDTSRRKSRPLVLGEKRIPTEQALSPGRELVIPDVALPNALPAARIMDVDPGRSLGWETGLLEFTDEPLGSAVERMNRYGTQKLRVTGTADRAIPISGQFEGGDTEAFVEGVTSVFPVKAVRDADGTIELRSNEH
jgi:transmembrane sensor